MLPGQRRRAEVGRHPAKASQAARDLRPRVDLAQDGQRLGIPAVRVGVIPARPREIAETELCPRNAPPVVDGAHDAD
jgi:hypothetical protein